VGKARCKRESHPSRRAPPQGGAFWLWCQCMGILGPIHRLLAGDFLWQSQLRMRSTPKCGFAPAYATPCEYAPSTINRKKTPVDNRRRGLDVCEQSLIASVECSPPCRRTPGAASSVRERFIVDYYSYNSIVYITLNAHICYLL
jgi:hypothetical protein